MLSLSRHIFILNFLPHESATYYATAPHSLIFLCITISRNMRPMHFATMISENNHTDCVMIDYSYAQIFGETIVFGAMRSPGGGGRCKRFRLFPVITAV